MLEATENDWGGSLSYQRKWKMWEGLPNVVKGGCYGLISQGLGESLIGPRNGSL